MKTLVCTLVVLAVALAEGSDVAVAEKGGMVREAARVKNGHWMHAQTEADLERMADLAGVSRACRRPAATAIAAAAANVTAAAVLTTHTARPRCWSLASRHSPTALRSLASSWASTATTSTTAMRTTPRVTSTRTTSS